MVAKDLSEVLLNSIYGDLHIAKDIIESSLENDFIDFSTKEELMYSMGRLNANLNVLLANIKETIENVRTINRNDGYDCFDDEYDEMYGGKDDEENESDGNKDCNCKDDELHYQNGAEKIMENVQSFLNELLKTTDKKEKVIDIKF